MIKLNKKNLEREKKTIQEKLQENEIKKLLEKEDRWCKTDRKIKIIPVVMKISMEIEGK